MTPIQPSRWWALIVRRQLHTRRRSRLAGVSMQNRGGVDGSSPTPHTLRPYQEECIAASLKAFEEGVKRQAVSLPVGSGKTVIFSNLIPRIPVKVEGATRTLVLAHRGELLEQAKTQIQNNAPLVVMKDQGSKKLEADDLKDADVVVASVQTLGRANTSRFDLYKPELFKCIIIDEAHHAASASYQRVLEKFGALKPESHILVWGCSATLRREDGRSLGVAFEKIVYHKPFIEMIREKHLSNLRVGTVKTDILVDGIRVTAGDYDTAQLSMAVNVDRRNICVVEAWKQYAHEHPTHKRKMTVAFAVDVAHIESLTQAFRDAGIDARGVNGNMSTAERNDTIEDFRKGLFPVIVNCGILTEGVDIPGIDCVLLARPTRSSVLLQQMIGRGLRKYKCPNGVEKADCLVLDFVDVTRREAGMRMTVPSLLGLRSDFEMKPVMKEGARRGGSVDNETWTLEELMEKDNDSFLQPPMGDEDDYDMDGRNVELDIRVKYHQDFLSMFGKRHGDEDLANQHIRTLSRLSWVQVGPKEYVLQCDKTKSISLKNEGDLYVAYLRSKRKSKKSHWQYSSPILSHDSLRSAIQACDTWVQDTFRSQIRLIEVCAPWRSKPATDAQVKALNALGERDWTGVSRGVASDMLTRVYSGGKGKAEKAGVEARKLEKREKAMLKKRRDSGWEL